MGHKFQSYSDFNINLPDLLANTATTDLFVEGDATINNRTIQPARYHKQMTDPISGELRQAIHINLANTSETHRPRSWNPIGWWIPIVGWRAMDRVIQDCLDAYEDNKISSSWNRPNEFIFRNWAANHERSYVRSIYNNNLHPKQNISDAANSLGPLMPKAYPSDSVYAGETWADYPQVGNNEYFLDSWHEFREYWEDREGLTFSIYYGSLHHLNRGSYARPDFYFIRQPTEDHPEAGNTVTLPDGSSFDVPADAKDDSFALLRSQIRWAMELGFKNIYADVGTRILTAADDTDIFAFRYTTNQAPVNDETNSFSMPQSPGIAKAFEDDIYNDSVIGPALASGNLGLHFEPFYSIGNQLKSIAGLHLIDLTGGGSRYETSELEQIPTVIESIINPGNSHLMWAEDNGVTWIPQNFVDFQNVCIDHGWIPAFQWNTCMVNAETSGGSSLNIRTHSESDQPPNTTLINPSYFTQGGPI